jgi:hypothetical protein
MALSSEEIIEQALHLPREDQARVVELLLENLHGPLDAELEREWGVEAESLLDGVLAGEVSTSPGEVALNRIRNSSANEL